MTFPWHPPQFSSVRPLPALPPGRYQKHHIFPQAEDLARWFKLRGIDIHQYTLLIPEHVHRRIHGGGHNGGQWNEAWRQFVRARLNQPVSREEIYQHAGELIFRFELTGPVVPYFWKFR